MAIKPVVCERNSLRIGRQMCLWNDLYCIEATTDKLLLFVCWLCRSVVVPFRSAITLRHSVKRVRSKQLLRELVHSILKTWLTNCNKTRSDLVFVSTNWLPLVHTVLYTPCPIFVVVKIWRPITRLFKNIYCKTSTITQHTPVYNVHPQFGFLS